MRVYCLVVVCGFSFSDCVGGLRFCLFVLRWFDFCSCCIVASCGFVCRLRVWVCGFWFVIGVLFVDFVSGLDV